MTDPYYQDDHVKLYHGDCLELADLWTCADVLVTDPPYGMAYTGFGGRHGEPRRYREACSIVGDEATTARDRALSMWGERPALVFGRWSVIRPEGVRQVLIWDKSDGGPGMGALDLPWGPSFEEVYVLGKGYVGKREGAVIRQRTIMSGDHARPDHPTPKPVPLMEALIAKCPPGTIADPFAGSGSTLVAAKALGRRAIGVELEERYCEIAARRLAQDVLDFGEAS